MALRFYNTLTQQVEEFVPADGHTVRMYTCGPTVYNYVHIGNLRYFTFVDVLRRWLRTHGWKLDHVMNITDVEDKIIRSAMQQNKTIQEYTATYENGFLEDIRTLRLETPERMVRATAHIDDMVQAIERLNESGYTYVSDGSTYYRIANFPEYGKLAHLHFGGIRAGARVDVDEYEKDDARDFVLWKAKKDGEPSWRTSIGDGRPGWHIECSVMAMKYLGQTLDIHAGGVDLIFPHHENEIAQSEAITGKPFSRFWIHSEHLIVEGQKMSKSLGNFYTLRDLTDKGYRPESIRFLLAKAHYRNKLNFTFDELKGADTAIDRLRSFKLRLDTERFPEGLNEQLLERRDNALSQFTTSLDDDLNTAEALAAVFAYIRDANTAMDAGEFRSGNVSAALNLLSRFDEIFDVIRTVEPEQGITPEEIDASIAERIAAKKSRNFARADEIRKELLERGIILEDTKEGTRWKRK